LQVRTVEEKLGEATSVSVDRDVLGDQIEEQQTLAVDIETRRPRVLALAEACPPQHRSTVDELLDRFDNLQTRCERRGKVCTVQDKTTHFKKLTAGNNVFIVSVIV